MLKSDSYRQDSGLTDNKQQLLLNKIAQGDCHAFWQLWMLYQDYLYYRCLSWMGGNRTDAEEALSQARLKAWEKLPNYASTITNPKAWLTRMTHNLCVDIHRQHQRQAKNTESIETLMFEGNEITSPNSNPESAMITQELEIYIHCAINNLSPRLRETFILYCYDRMSYIDIAQRLAITRDSAYKRIQQSRSILQKRLRKYLSGSDNSSFNTTKKISTTVESQFENLKHFNSSSIKYQIEPISYQVTATWTEKTFTRSIPLTLPSGVKLNINLFLEEKPARQEQKLKTLTDYVYRYPSGWKKRLELADLLYETGNWKQAVEEYHQVLERLPQRIDLQLKLAKILQLMGKQNNAIAIYENTLPSTENSATRHHIRGAIAVCQDDPQGAIIAFTSATSLEPENAVHWLALGQIQMTTEDFKAALQAFDTILSLQPDDLIALIYSYDALIAIGNVAEAQQRLNRARRIAPNDYQVLKRSCQCRCRLGLVLGEEGKQTKQMISAALRLAPNAADVHELLAYYYILRGEKEKGVGVLLSFTEQHPNSPSGWYYYARCLFHTGDTQAAAEAIFNAGTLSPNNREIYQSLCEILTAAGR